MLDRNGLTNAGRGLQKHGSRPGSVFPKTNGKASTINEQGQFILDEILTDPNSTMKFSHKTKFGNVLDIKALNGRGVRYNQKNEFVMFLEP
jgi:filamentous hemagglutinin